MAETDKIAEIAEKISSEIFTDFLWERVGTKNSDWPCEDQALHGAPTHPTDVVFYYDEPYSSERTYVQCDLKSYKKSSITKTAVHNAMISLSHQVSCAEKSDEWRDRYFHKTQTPAISGLLFVYNHDGEYDKDFRSYLYSFDNSKQDLPKGSKMVVLGPEDINWLHNVSNELRRMRSDPNKALRIPDLESCRYFYPQLSRKANLAIGKARAATLEMLTGPWIILEYEKSSQDNSRGFVVFYRRDGKTTEEFMYLLEYLRLHNVLTEKTDVQIKTLNVVANASAKFNQAKQRFIEGIDSSKHSELAELVDAIKYSSMTAVISQFSSVELGMD